VIGHQAICVEVERASGFLGFEKGAKLRIVLVRPENALAIIATSNDVIQPACYFNSGFPGHRRRIRRRVVSR
jgi:hypothetical protein